MILIRRLAAPRGLLAKQHEWTERWANGRPADWATQAARRTLQESLPRLTHGKCAYCESILGKAGWLEIEHYHAKTVEPSLCFEWTNLFPACGVCNGSKREQSHSGQLLKPDQDDGERHFWLVGHSGELQPSDIGHANRALATISICDLNRATLCRERHRLFRQTTRLLSALKLNDVELRHEFDTLLQPTTEHKIAVRSALPASLADADRRMYHATD